MQLFWVCVDILYRVIEELVVVSFVLREPVSGLRSAHTPAILVLRRSLGSKSRRDFSQETRDSLLTRLTRCSAGTWWLGVSVILLLLLSAVRDKREAIPVSP